MDATDCGGFSIVVSQPFVHCCIDRDETVG